MELSYPRQELFHSPHSACPGCSIALALRYFLKAMGHEVTVVMPVGCSGVIVHLPKRRIYHDDQLIKVLSVPFGSTAIFAGGVKAGLVAKGDLSTEVVAWAGDGATFDIGFQGLSASAERNEDIIYVCADNEAYMNTGNQKSSATPENAVTSTNPYPKAKSEGKKDIDLILAAHKIPYLCTVSIAYPSDFMRKVEKAKGIRGFRFFHVLCPCTTGWRFPSQSTVRISRLAVETGVFPLFEVERGVDFIVNKGPTGLPVGEYTSLQGRFSSLTLEQINAYQRDIDERWARLRWLAAYQTGGVRGKRRRI